MDLSSTALTQGSDMPQQYICEGDDVAPPLCWSDVPDRTRSLALIVDDPDSANASLAQRPVPVKVDDQP